MTRGYRSIVVVGMLTGLAVVAPITAGAASASTAANSTCDVDADGYGDLVIGMPGEAVSSLADAGRLVVVYGSPAFIPKKARTTVIDQATPGVKSEPAPGERFGSAVACADFDGDGFDDVAVGVPGQEAGGRSRAGAVHVFMGTDSGLTTVGDFLWTQGVPGVPGATQTQDRLGSALAAGDFNGDGYADLAAGAPFDDDPGRNSGAVNILVGGPSGLTPGALFTQLSSGVPSNPEWGDGFGAALAAGDFDGDGHDDLAVGSPTEGIGSLTAGGIVVVLPGTAGGLTGSGSVMWHQDMAGVEDKAETFDRFGAALAAGDANGDGRDELAIGVPGENSDSGADSGMVHVLVGSAGGLTATGAKIWEQSRPALPGTAGSGHRFGAALAFGDVTGDGFADLAIGAPGDSSAGALEAGSVTVLKGSTTGIRARNIALTQTDIRGGGLSQVGDQFGASITLADVDGDGTLDVAAASPGEDLGLVADAGDVIVWFGTARNPYARKARRVTEAVVTDSAASRGDAFGTVGSIDLEPPDVIDTLDSKSGVSSGSSSGLVADLEGTLARAGFYREVADGVYDERLSSAIVGFHKAVGRPRLGYWEAGDWARLDAFVADLPARTEPDRIEINLTRQVLYLVEQHELTAITPVASGTSETPTPVGNYTIGRHIVEWRVSHLGRLYYPWYFYGGYAIHGSTSVPTQPASHGCVRIELWESLNLESRFYIGLPVHIAW